MVVNASTGSLYITGINFDKNSNLWSLVTNSPKLIQVRKKNNTWALLDFSQTVSAATVSKVIFDKHDQACALECECQCAGGIRHRAGPNRHRLVAAPPRWHSDARAPSEAPSSRWRPTLRSVPGAGRPHSKVRAPARAAQWPQRWAAVSRPRAFAAVPGGSPTKVLPRVLPRSSPG